MLDFAEYLDSSIDSLTDEVVRRSPSEWAETHRKLSRSQSSIPGDFSFVNSPHTREIVDCLDPRSPVRYIDVLKGVQAGLTTSVLENYVGYCMSDQSWMPLLMFTSNLKLAKERLEKYIVPMVDASGLRRLIASIDTTNSGKKGQKIDELQWLGGGSLLVRGAEAESGMRSHPAPALLCDEIDTFPFTIKVQGGGAGDPLEIIEGRATTYENSKKILCLSTPLILHTSKIYARFLMGDQRRYYVPCLDCGHMQYLEFFGRHEDGRKYGIIYKLNDKMQLDRDSVFYVCKNCGALHTNDDKAVMLPRGEWRPTADPVDPTRRSYHVPGLLSPPGQATWTYCVEKWLACIDRLTGRVVDPEKLQVFKNNIEGMPFEQRETTLKVSEINRHVCMYYVPKMVPNTWMYKVTGHRACVVTAAVDVHENHIDYKAVAWFKDYRGVTVEHWVHEEKGCGTNLHSAGWHGVRTRLENGYDDKEGRHYFVSIALIDSSWEGDTVRDFCAEYETDVLPIVGVDDPKQKPVTDGFVIEHTASGHLGARVFVAQFKDACSEALRHQFDHTSPMPPYTFLFPKNTPNEVFKQIASERKVALKDTKTGVIVAYKWEAQTRNNHAWDLLVYNRAAIAMKIRAFTENIAPTAKGLLEHDFWQAAENTPLYYVET